MTLPGESLIILTHSADPENLPHYASAGASGADVRAHIERELLLPPGASCKVPTGLTFEIPDGYEIQVRPRSGLALHSQITVLNTPGTIDADYRGELCVILINHGREPFCIIPRMRIAQLVVAPVIRATFTLNGLPLAATGRGSGGFGHSGTH